MLADSGLSHFQVFRGTRKATGLDQSDKSAKIEGVEHGAIFSQAQERKLHRNTPPLTAQRCAHTAGMLASEHTETAQNPLVGQLPPTQGSFMPETLSTTVS